MQRVHWGRPPAALLLSLMASVVAVSVAFFMAPTAAALRQTGGPRVVAGNTVLADFVARVGEGRLASVASVVPAGVEVENYNPKPEDIRNVAQADLMVANGLALDRWIPKLVAAAKPGMPILVLSDGLPAEGIGESEDDDVGESGNPHFWLDVHYAKVYVERLRDELSRVDPDAAAVYSANAAAYLGELDDLDGWIHAQVATIPPDNRKLVTFHEAYPYLADHYGFELVGVITPSPGQEPSAGELAALVEKVKAARVKAVFSESQFSPRLTESLAREAGIERVVTDLYNDSVGDPPADSYLGMMRSNFEQITRALQ